MFCKKLFKFLVIVVLKNLPTKQIIFLFILVIIGDDILIKTMTKYKEVLTMLYYVMH